MIKNSQRQYYFTTYPQYKDELIRLFEWVQQAYCCHYVVETTFLTTWMQKVLVDIAKDFIVVFDGGMENATYQKARLYPKNAKIEKNFCPVVFCEYDVRFYKITHKDVLGALLSQQLNKNRIGDIYIDDRYIYVSVDCTMVDVVCRLDKIGRQKVNFKICEEKITKKQELVEKKYIVSSLRLDSIVKAICNVSREKAQKIITMGLVKTSFFVNCQNNYVLSENEEFSIRKYGKFCLVDASQKTKKDNYIVVVHHYM